MSGSVEFSRDDVVEEAGCDPWGTASDFSEEIDVAEMAAASQAFAAAAEEAGDAGELAASASEIAAEAGQRDNEHIFVPEEEVRITDQDLQGSGEDIEAVADLINSGTRLALDTETEVMSLRGDATEAYCDFQQDAYDELERLQILMQESADDDSRHLTGGGPSGQPAPPSVQFQGKTYTAAPSGFLGTDWAFPSSLVSAIRQHYLEKAAGSAEDIYEKITDEIDDYRAAMTRKAADLEDLGYDVADGPHDLWYNDAAADYYAERLQYELSREPPDPEGLAAATRAVNHIVGDLFDADGNPAGTLSEREHAFLDRFFHGLTAEDLARLGDPDLVPYSNDAGAGDAPHGLHLFHQAQQDVANAINALTNPDVNEVDVDAYYGGDLSANLPPAVSHYVYDFEQGMLFRDEHYGAPFEADLERFNGFGNLMAQATMPAGYDFSQDMARAAVDVQARTNGRGPDMIEAGYMENTGSNGLLLAASLNSEAAAGLLSEDDGFREAMTGLEWTDSSGAAALITSGTTVPAGTDHNDPAARPYIEAAFHVLSGAGDVSQGYWETTDHSSMHAAIGTTAADYMNMIARSGQPDSSSEFFGTGNWEIGGEDWNYSFMLSKEDREDLFNLVNQSDDEVRNQFRSQVTAWQYAVAQEAFDSGNPDLVEAALPHVATVEGFLTDADIEAVKAGVSPAAIRDSIVDAANMAAGLTGNPAVIVPTFGAGQAVKLFYTPADPGQEATREAIADGSLGVRYTVARAAVDTDYEGAGSIDLPATSDDPRVSSVIHERVNMIESRYTSPKISDYYDSAWQQDIFGG
ncbi:hypothetical protein GCM10009716_27180 [Streptomyces sodiiphilus]|uniref:Uncharacterized protein n=1 Tax=Streptomyces sodiiphilus TaxID=226217 RepID=A0ABN2PAN3_9ACTN